MTTVSFVVPSYNSARTITACVLSLRNQTHPDVEIVVVDNHSTDDTVARATAAGADAVITAGPERCAQRNRGARDSRGAIVVLHRLGHGHGARPSPPTSSRPSRRGRTSAPSSSPSGPSATASGPSAACWRSPSTWATSRSRPRVPSVARRSRPSVAGTRTSRPPRTGTSTTGSGPTASRWAGSERSSGTTRARLRLRGTFGKKRYYGQWIAAYLDAHDDGSRRIRRSGLLDRKGDLLRHPILTSGMVTLEVDRGRGHLRRHARRPQGAHRRPPRCTRVNARPERIVHLISEYSAHEAMGRTVTETALRVPGEHHLITTKAHDGGAVFASVHELGGRIESFPMSNRDRLHALLAEIQPDVVHLHAGALGPLLAQRSGLGAYPLVMTIYAWPGLPGRAAWRHAGWRGLRVEQRPARAGAGHGDPAAGPRAAVGAGAEPARHPEPRPPGAGAAVRLRRARSSTCPPVPRSTARRASRTPAAGNGPTVVFAGRSETVRGIGTLIDAFPAVRCGRAGRPAAAPAAPARGAAPHRRPVAASPVSDAIDIVTDPIPDLLGELAERAGGLLALPRRLHHVATGDGGRGGDGGRPAGRVHARRVRALGHATGRRRDRRAAG